MTEQNTEIILDLSQTQLITPPSDLSRTQLITPPEEAPRKSRARHSLDNRHWRWFHPFVIAALVLAVLLTAAAGQWTARKAQIPEIDFPEVSMIELPDIDLPDLSLPGAEEERYLATDPLPLDEITPDPNYVEVNRPPAIPSPDDDLGQARRTVDDMWAGLSYREKLTFLEAWGQGSIVEMAYQRWREKGFNQAEAEECNRVLAEHIFDLAKSRA
jgi:hypothetical protein